MKSKKKTCKAKGCNVKFYQANSLHQACSIACSIAIVEQKKAEKAKRQRRTDKIRLNELKPASYWANKAQVACNKYIRERDKDEPCISCGRHHDGQYHAGHYYGRKAHPELRFHHANIHKQCYPCNVHLSGNIENYRPALIEKVGAEIVDYLENFNVLQRLTIDDYREIEAFYKDRLKYMW